MAAQNNRPNDPMEFRLTHFFPLQKLTSILVYSELVSKVLEFKNQDTKVGCLHLLTLALEKSLKNMVDLNLFRVRSNIMVWSPAQLLRHDPPAAGRGKCFGRPKRSSPPGIQLQRHRRFHPLKKWP
jgi:hypothetical protein